MPGATPLRENGGRVSKTEGFFAIFFSGAPLSGKTRVECQKLRVFYDFGVPEFVLRIGPTTRFATYGRFFKKSKISENRKKTSKTDGFLRFFNVRSNPLRESGCRVSKTEGFLRFCARICPHDLFCHIRALQTLSQGAPRWFQRGLKPL